jgi:pterin-4a-carbinolamine dehydratase
MSQIDRSITTKPAAPVIQPIEEPSGDGLKAERIQEAIGIDPKGVTRLKAERVQLALRDLPGWSLQRNGFRISRTVAVADPQQAVQLLRQVADLGQAGWEMPDVQLSRGEVTLSLPTVDGSWLAAQHFELAKALDA